MPSAWQGWSCRFPPSSVPSWKRAKRTSATWLAVKFGTRGSLVGLVADVQFGAGEAPLLVVRRKSGERELEFLVPYAEAFLKDVNLAARRIEFELPEGLLELQTPLSNEEKQRQKLEAEQSRAAGERRKGHK